MPKLWIDPAPAQQPDELSAALGLHPFVSRTLSQRGLADPQAARAFLDPAHYQPAPASQLPGLVKAAERLERAIVQNEAILVWGDFDVDGQTSTSLLVAALRDLGAPVSYHIPVRATEGHGIQIAALQQFIPPDPSPLSPKLILTCDTGIAAHEAVAYANRQGVEVIITDHHQLPAELPPAYACINPHLLADESHPLADLPGVGVAYKLVEQLYTQAGRPLDCERFLDLVALGIVADVATQRRDTRYLLQRGLQMLRQAHRPALQAMLELAELPPTQLNEEHIAFLLAPRLNALGRLGDANPVVDFLTTTELGKARLFARQLESYNERRKLLTDQITQAAETQLGREPGLLNTPALVLAGAGWHTGVVGIVASRLVERYGKPAILLSLEQDGLAKGSARSVPGVQITAAIASQAELLTGYGGHAAAAGLALPADRIPDFRRGLAQAILEQLDGQALPGPQLQIAAYLPLVELSLELVDELERLAPFGAGNPALNLASRDLQLVSQRAIGRTGEHLRLVVADADGNQQNVLYWRGAGEALPNPETRFDLAYAVRANTFRAERQLQVEWLDFRVCSTVAPAVVEQPTIQVIDHRQANHPGALLKALREQYDPMVWAEAEARRQLDGMDRQQLAAAETLLIWTIPPGPGEWQAALQTVQPRRLVLFANDPGMDQPQPLLTRLAGLGKHVIQQRNGETSLAQLAAACAQRPGIIHMALLWLQAKGQIDFSLQADERLTLRPGNGQADPQLDEIQQELSSMLAESAAYRRYFSRAQVQALVRNLTASGETHAN